MKGSLAALLAAVKGLNEAGVELAGDLILTGVADEELGQPGHGGYPAPATAPTLPSSPSRLTFLRISTPRFHYL